MFTKFRKNFGLFSIPLGYYLANEWNNRFRKPKCCGILGVLTVQNNAEAIVMEGIHLLENRGYDSAGIVSVNKNGQNQLVLSKYASDPVQKDDCFVKIEKELFKHKVQNKNNIWIKNSQAALGHTRWATCGAKVDRNAHPHVDMKNRIALVHNGTLENFNELKEILIKEHNIEFKSETDTEVIVQFIGVFLNSGMQLMQAVTETLTLLKGQWGLVILDSQSPDEMIVCRQGSPLLVGYNSTSLFAASEKIAFEKYTQNYITLKDGESIKLNLKEREGFIQKFSARVQILPCGSPVSIKPKFGYSSFFEQEINEQPNSCLRALGNGGRLAGSDDSSKLGGLERYEQEICHIKNIVMVGCGSSNNAAQSLIHLFKKMRIFESVSIIEGSEFTKYDIPQTLPGIIVLSQSGETKDLVTALKEAKDQGAFSIGIVNVVGSMIATMVDCGIYLNCGREVAVAATKSFLSQLIALVLLILWIGAHKEKKSLQQKNDSYIHSFKPLRQKIIESLRSLPMVIGQCLEECKKSTEEVAHALLPFNTILILGKGPCGPIAKEGALKIKELTYKHAEGFSAGELKHGPLALIDSHKNKSTPVILIILNDDYLNDMTLALSEVHSRNALTIVISNCPEKLLGDKQKIDYFIKIPHLAELGWILAVLPFQLITLSLCEQLNINPDKPRNLAKTVTVG